MNLEGATIDPYVKQCGEASVMYHYCGKSIFPWPTQHWWRWGLCAKNWGQDEHVVNHGIQQGFPKHASIRELRIYSDICVFIMRVRNNFLNVSKPDSSKNQL